MPDYNLPKEKVLILRTCRPDMTSYGGFKWPETGLVVCPDWENTLQCGNGLHGWLWGSGNYNLKYRSHDAKWLVVEVDSNAIITLDGKVKFPEGEVIFYGSYKPAYDLVMKWFWLRHADELKTLIADDPNSNHASKDDTSAVTTKPKAHASATGKYGHASAAGDSGHASAVGKYGHASAAGYSGHASAAGKYGHASAAGKYGHASAAGFSGHAMVFGFNGKARCGENGALILTYWDGIRARHVIGYAGENGIKFGKWYQLNSTNDLEEITDSI